MYTYTLGKDPRRPIYAIVGHIPGYIVYFKRYKDMMYNIACGITCDKTP
jgi:hypothetical protein